MTSKSIVAQSGLLWSVCILVLQRCDRRWRFTSCFTYQTTSWTLAHLQTTTLKGINVLCNVILLKLACMSLCLYNIIYIHTLCDSCRCESLNSTLRGFNVHGNRQSPSRDIGRAFSAVSMLHILASSTPSDSQGWAFVLFGFTCIHLIY